MPSTVTKNPHSSDKELWEGVIEYLPKDCSLSRVGVHLDKKNPVLISGPCWVSALTRSQHGNDWGIVVHWIDQDGTHRHSAFPVNRLQDSRCSIATDLASFGLKVIPGRHRPLMEYLGGFDLPKDYRLQSVSKLGWLFNDDGSMVYVFPDDLISIEKTEEIIFQPEEHSPTTNTMTVKGSLDAWLNNVAQPCVNNPLLIFSLCTSFAAPLLAFAGLEGGGFHLYGGSSKGKTTALQVSASVWGSGADPAASENSYVGRWNTTANALEGTAAAHNDGLLALDEMGTCDAKDFGKVVYDLSSGQGKARMNKNSTLRSQTSWRSLILSTGEISSRQKIEESGKKVQIGHEVRMVDIPIVDGVFIKTHGKNPGDFANALKKNTGKYYGIAGREFIKRLIEYEANHFALKKYVRDQLESWQDDLSEDRVLESFQQRVIQRFALLTVAGHLAVKFGLLPMTETEITVAIITVLKRWLGDESNLPAVLRGVRVLQDFYVANGESRFKDSSNTQPNTAIRNLAGYTHSHNGESFILFTEAGFKEACDGYDHKSILKELKKRRILVCESGKLTKKFKIPALNTRMYFYAVKLSFLDDISK